MKKKLAVCLSALLLASFLGSCAPNEENNNTVKENYYNPEAGINREVLEGNVIENGNSTYAVVYGNNATEAEKFAAEQMQTYLEKVTGVVVPVVSERALLSNKNFISVGQTELLEESSVTVDYDSLNGDGFVLKTVGNDLYITGANDRGTLYGVYDFLEKICGVRFLDINYEHIPASDTVPLYQMDVVEVPTFKYRGNLVEAVFHTSETSGGSSHGRNGAEVAEYYTKVRQTHEFLREESQVVVDEKMGGSISINKDINQTHNNLTYVPADDYFFTTKQKEENAHMFYVLDGKAVDICYSDGITKEGTIAQVDEMTAAKAYLEGLKKYIKQNPTAEYYTVGQEDLRSCCSCETCYSRTLEYGSTTANVILFYNAMAREIQKWADTQPDLGGKTIKIVEFSYLFSAQAPVKTIKNENGEVTGYEPVHPMLMLPENVVLRIADINAHVYYCLLDEANDNGVFGPEYFEKWKAVMGDNKQTWYWGYLTTHGELFNYVPSLHKVKETLLGLEELGTEYAFLQHNSQEYVDYKAMMENYVVSKLLWNPHQDAVALRNEFMTLYYGIAAEEINEFTVNYEEWVGDIIQNKDRRFFENSSNPQYMPLSFVDSQISILDKAIAKISASDLSEEEKATLIDRVKVAKLYPAYRKLINRNSFYSGDTEKQNEVTKEFFDLCEHFGVLYYAEHHSITELKAKYPYL